MERPERAIAPRGLGANLAIRNAIAKAHIHLGLSLKFHLNMGSM